MNLIFLDIDGVLNSGEFVIKIFTLKLPRYDQYGNKINVVDSDMVKRLNTIILETNSKIVLSSCWRSEGIDNMKWYFSQWGIDPDLLIDVTPPNRGTHRGWQIQEWLDTNYIMMREFHNFIIIDDGEDMVHLKPHLIQTNYQHGLQDIHVERAITYLNKR
jgi:hypothetical protein